MAPGNYRVGFTLKTTEECNYLLIYFILDIDIRSIGNPTEIEWNKRIIN